MLIDLALRLGASFAAGLGSVASPCVLPVVPIIITGNEEDHRYRPLLIVAGISITFILMGIASAAFGSLLAGGTMIYVEKGAGVMILLFGLLTLADLNLFKGFHYFQRLGAGARGPWSGLILGMALGLIWIPCIGPFLTSILAMVASEGEVLKGILFLGVYSLGFAVPMLIAAYFSRYFRERVRRMQRHPMLLRIFSGGILSLFGLYILFNGIVGFGF